jgi:hypothetical protein
MRRVTYIRCQAERSERKWGAFDRVNGPALKSVREIAIGGQRLIVKL